MITPQVSTGHDRKTAYYTTYNYLLGYQEVMITLMYLSTAYPEFVGFQSSPYIYFAYIQIDSYTSLHYVPHFLVRPKINEYQLYHVSIKLQARNSIASGSSSPLLFDGSYRVTSPHTLGPILSVRYDPYYQPQLILENS